MRRHTIQRLSHCFNCLAESHHLNNCQSVAVCRHCAERHHTLLHLGAPASVQSTMARRSPERPPARQGRLASQAAPQKPTDASGQVPPSASPPRRSTRTGRSPAKSVSPKPRTSRAYGRKALRSVSSRPGTRRAEVRLKSPSSESVRSNNSGRGGCHHGQLPSQRAARDLQMCAASSAPVYLTTTQLIGALHALQLPVAEKSVAQAQGGEDVHAQRPRCRDGSPDFTSSSEAHKKYRRYHP